MDGIIQMGRKLTYLLRHDKQYAFDNNGWREVDNLVANYGFSHQLIEEIVESNDKQRFEFNSDKTKIRARQGHSVPVDVELEETVPPDYLFHGTARQNLESIMRNGILKGNRLYVHLSQTEQIATSVGKRHGEPVVIRVLAKRMSEDGIKFFLSRNGVYLTDYIPVKYLEFVERIDWRQR